MCVFQIILFWGYVWIYCAGHVAALWLQLLVGHLFWFSFSLFSFVSLSIPSYQMAILALSSHHMLTKPNPRFQTNCTGNSNTALGRKSSRGTPFGRLRATNSYPPVDQASVVTCQGGRGVVSVFVFLVIKSETHSMCWEYTLVLERGGDVCVWDTCF